MRFGKVLAGFVGVVCAAMGGDGLGGPVTGYVFDARHATIRPIEGLPGSARLGSGLGGDKDLADCAVSSGQRLALCRTSGDGSWMVVTWSGDAVTTREIPGLAGPAEAVLLSDDGEHAAVHFQSGGESEGRLVFLRDLAGAGTVSASPDTGTGSRLLAFAPDGNRVLMANERELWVVDRIAGAQRLAGGANIRAAAFSRDGGVYFADLWAKELWKLERAETGAEAVRILTLASGVDQPVAMAACAAGDGEQVGIVDGATAQVDILQLDSRRMEQLSVWGRPSRMVRLNQYGLYALNQPGPAPLLLFDCVAHTAHFVPVD